LKAKPVANHANAQPDFSLVVIGFCNQHCATSPPQNWLQNRHHQEILPDRALNFPAIFDEFEGYRT
jgi:hypothetical protein